MEKPHPKNLKWSYCLLSEITTTTVFSVIDFIRITGFHWILFDVLGQIPNNQKAQKVRFQREKYDYTSCYFFIHI